MPKAAGGLANSTITQQESLAIANHSARCSLLAVAGKQRETIYYHIIILALSVKISKT